MSGFVFDLGMNIENFTKSISEVEDELKRLKDSLKTATGQGIVETNVQIKQLEKSLVDLKKVGLDKLPGGITNASNALNSLSQVTRDLPFGFVAIQNNLPLVVDSFGDLFKKSQGLGPALKSIGSALIGPAGISFAFGAVIAGVTALIQKYGSLGEALNQLGGGTKKLTEQQILFNKEVQKATGNVAAEEAKVQILTKTLIDNKKPQSDRIAAYNELKQIAPDVIAGIRQENIGTEITNELINAQAESRKQLIKLKIQEAGINSVLAKNAENIAIEQDKLNKLIVERDVLLSKQKRGQKYIDPETGKEFDIVSSLLPQVTKQIADQRVELKKYTDINDRFISQLDPIVNGISNINEQTRIRIELLKKEDAQLKQNEKSGLSALIAKNKKELAEFNKELSQPLRFEAAYVDLFPKFDEQLKNASKGLEAFRKKNVEVETNKKGPVFVPSQSFLDAQNKLKIFQENLAAVRNNLQNVFFDPLTDLFTNFFETGKLAFGEFAKVVIKTISQIVAKILATGVINLLANLIGVGGVSTGLGKGIGGVLKAAVGSVLGLNFGGGIAAPSFAGVGGGSLGMSGQVNLVLRGQDLVGSLNRTNTLINRVG
jgi:hypothetical protein